MLAWFGKWATRTASNAPAFLTLLALGGLAFWGWSNDWQLPRLGGENSATEETEGHPAIKVIVASPSPGSTPENTALASVTRIEFPSASAVSKSGIQVAAVQRQTLVQAVTCPGMIDYEPARYARLTPRASGTVWRVYKEIGDLVSKGDVLALIESAEVGRAKAEFLQNLAQLKLRSQTLERLQTLDRQTAVPERSMWEAQTATREARIRVFNDQQALLNLGLPVRLQEMEKLSEDQQVRRLRLLGLPEAVARHLDPETLTANLLPLAAPFDCQVVERNAATGEVVQNSQPKPLFVVADVRLIHVDFDVNPEDMMLVRTGQPVTFQPQGGGAEVAGRVSHLSPEVNEKTRRVRVHAEVPNEDRRLRPNTFGTGRIVVGERPQALVVAAEAVQSHGPASLVFVRVSDTTFEARPVRLGLRQGNLVEVHGVREGEQVVTAGSFQLKSELQKERIAGSEE
jgi:cobalt-zinc-cadmium efflux system membrane fusion protein